MKLVQLVVLLSMVLYGQLVCAKISYEQISCLVGDSVIFLTVPMDESWGPLEMEDAGKAVCESMALVRVLPGKALDAEEE